MARNRDWRISHLCQCINRDRLALKLPREARVAIVKQLAGNYYSENASPKKRPVNMLALYMSIVGRQLVPKTPKVMLSTFNREYKPLVNYMQIWCNDRLRRMQYEHTAKRVVLDSLFCMGITKVAIASPADAARFSWRLKAGHPFAERVDLDDFVVDMHARDFSEVTYIGHRYRAPLEVVREMKEFNSARKDLEMSTDNPYNAQGDERVSMIGRTYYESNSDEYEPMVDLWEIYMPRHRCILTLADQSLSGIDGVEVSGKIVALREQEWVGPDTGPYHILGLQTIPGNLIPKGPLQDICDLDEIVNNAARKLARQMQRQKSVLPVQKEEDAQRVNTADDGTAVRSDGQTPKEVRYGGPDAAMLTAFTQFRELTKEQAGNLDSLGGLNPQAKTLGQDKILNDNSSATLGSMQEAVMNHERSVFDGLCWYEFHHPMNEMEVPLEIPGQQGMTQIGRVTPQQRRQMSWEDLAVAVNPYSAQSQTPSSKMQAIMGLLNQVVLPALPAMGPQGINIKWSRLLEILGDFSDLPEFQEILDIGEPPQADMPAPSQGEPPGMPNVTPPRETVRYSLPGRTNKGNANHLMASLMGDAGGSQNGNGSY